MMLEYPFLDNNAREMDYVSITLHFRLNTLLRTVGTNTARHVHTLTILCLWIVYTGYLVTLKLDQRYRPLNLGPSAYHMVC